MFITSLTRLLILCAVHGLRCAEEDPASVVEGHCVYVSSSRLVNCSAVIVGLRLTVRTILAVPSTHWLSSFHRNNLLQGFQYLRSGMIISQQQRFLECEQSVVFQGASFLVLSRWL